MKSNLEVYINEQTVVKNEIYSAFKEFVECSICKNIIINPVMCMNCQNSYCRKCIEKLPKNEYKCPYGCVNPNYQKSKEKIIFYQNLNLSAKNAENIFYLEI